MTKAAAFSPFDVSERVAVITGASSGLGAHFARVLVGAGAKVALLARRRERLDALVSELSEQRALALSCDVSVDTDIEAAAKATLERFGQVDILVNNAGVSDSHPAEEESPELFRRVVDVNLSAVFACCHTFGKPMLERGRGNIVNIASMLGAVASAPIPNASYCASKGGVVNLTRELGAQWGRRGIRVNGIAPGYFPSEMTAEMGEDPKTMQFLRRNTPLGRTGELAELDGPLLLLASDASSFMAGQTLFVDGGWTIR